MAFQVSPGVNVSEIDLTTIIPAVSSSTGAVAAHTRWGPVNQRVLVDSEVTLVNNFGQPNTNTASDWFTAANFLSYGNSLYVVRAVRANTSSTDALCARNATTNSANTKVLIVKNDRQYDELYSSTGLSGVGQFVARYPGELGNSLRISVCPTANGYESTVSASSILATNGSTTLTFSVTGTAKTGRRRANSTVSNTVATAFATSLASANAVQNGGSNTSATTTKNKFVVGDILVLGPDKIVVKAGSIGSVSTTTVTTVTQVANSASNTPAIVSATDTSTFSITLQNKYVGNTTTSTSLTRRWEFFDNVPGAPETSTAVSRNGGSNDEVHIVVVDEDGRISGIANSILEIYPNLSKATGATNEVGTNIFYKNYIHQNSKYVYWMSHPSGWGSAGSSYTSGRNFGLGTQPVTNVSFYGGKDGNVPREADYINAYNLFKNAEEVDVSIVLGASSTATRSIHIINNICEYRKDCIAVLSPRQSDVVNNSGYAGSEAEDIISYRDSLPSSSYAIMDSGWKYQYDKYNDLYRYVPLNGDVAGTMVRTDLERDPWWSPAGFNRGQIKNVIRLAYSPNKTDRDQLYKKGINPIVTFPGEGTILYGDKTLLAKPSAFDRINVRRLFIVLEKAIATAAKYTLFEFNDAFTRAQFRSIVEPFLRDVQGRRGITDFRVVCDETNNTAEVIDRNEFVGDIYIKPARSINFIQLNFVAVRTGVDFSEVVGKF
jgi:phage tail sheath protein FI